MLLSLTQSSYLTLLRAEAGPRLPFILGCGLISGLFEALSVVFINSAVSQIAAGAMNFRQLGLFAVSVALYLYGDRQVLNESLNIVGRMMYDAHVRIVNKLSRSSALEYERIERSQIYTTLIEQTDIVIEATRYLADGISNVTMVVISAIYIASLSTEAFVMVVVIFACALLLFSLVQKSVISDLKKIKVLEQRFLTLVNHFLNGFKEVKIHGARRVDLVQNHIIPVSNQAKTLKTLTEIRSSTNFLYTRGLFFILIAAVVFILPHLVTTQASTITAIVAVVLFSIAPLGQIILGVPFLTKAELAIASIQALEQQLDAIDDERHTTLHNPFAAPYQFRQITLKGLTFSYTDAEGQQTFKLGPLDFQLRQGEMVFLAGGNGSGKTTLLKLIAGLYYPQAGSLEMDDARITPGQYHHYRQFFSIILPDFYLMDRLYGLEPIDPDIVSQLLKQMALHQKTAYLEGRFTNLNLSSGQRKRLALITSFLEDRPVLLFDEIAADLDPEFRQYFYHIHLPKLKEAGKTIVLASHDDRFFHLADRVIRMEYGQIVRHD